MLRLFALFTIVPTVELYLLFQLGTKIGIAETIWMVLLTGFVGASMAKREGKAVIVQLQKDLGKGLPPADHLIEGLMVFGGGLLLITPGVLTDIFGFSAIIPLTRKLLAPMVRNWATKRFKGGLSPMGSNIQFGHFQKPGSPEIEVVDEKNTERPQQDDGPTFKHPQY